ncbi:hypothetical protein JTB14_013294 [Gonioctena quinquepunctata]|nr:hypothetical protein JTB14_013294 [Gonioctena quinquepunctata]
MVRSKDNEETVAFSASEKVCQKCKKQGLDTRYCRLKTFAGSSKEVQGAVKKCSATLVAYLINVSHENKETSLMTKTKEEKLKDWHLSIKNMKKLTYSEMVIGLDVNKKDCDDFENICEAKQSRLVYLLTVEDEEPQSLL